MRKAIGVACLTVGVWWLGAGVAAAGIYDVHGCRLPNGKLIAADGWQAHREGDGGRTSNTCARGGSLLGELDGTKTLSRLTMAGWVFDAPPDTTIDNYTLHRTSRVTKGSEDLGRNAWLYHDAAIIDVRPPTRYAQYVCLAHSLCMGQGDPRAPLALANVYQDSSLRILRLFFVSQCDSVTRCLPTVTSNVQIWASRIGVEDPHAPAFTRQPEGDLVRAGAVLEGTRAVSFSAEDRGGGIARVAFVVDGQVLDEQVAQSSSVSCRRPYVLAVPCPLKLQRSLGFDTRRISNGKHAIQVAVIDAAGNRTLSLPVEVEVRNRGVPNGAGATPSARIDAWFASPTGSRRARTVVPYGSSRAIIGRLTTPDGAPITGAALDIAARSGRPGSRALLIGQVTTNASGMFRHTPAAGTSRTFTISYRAFTLDASPSATKDVVLKSRAGIAFKVSPKRVSARGVVKFKGRLRGGPGRAGTQVMIYALGGARSRIPVATVRANSQGRFSYRYRFRNSSPGTTYRFRATLHAQPAYPYAGGSSRVVTLRIR